MAAISTRRDDAGGQRTGDEIVQQIAHRSYLRAEGQRCCAAKKQSLADVAGQALGQLLVDAELADLGVAVAQAALEEAVELERAARLPVRDLLDYLVTGALPAGVVAAC